MLQQIENTPQVILISQFYLLWTKDINEESNMKVFGNIKNLEIPHNIHVILTIDILLNKSQPVTRFLVPDVPLKDLSDTA